MERDKILNALEAFFEKRNLSVQENSAILAEGLIDSVDLMEMVLHLEENLGIEVNQDILTLENFDHLGTFVDSLHKSLHEQ